MTMRKWSFRENEVKFIYKELIPLDQMGFNRYVYIINRFSKDDINMGRAERTGVTVRFFCVINKN